jgi:hypothetical protein
VTVLLAATRLTAALVITGAQSELTPQQRIDEAFPGSGGLTMSTRTMKDLLAAGWKPMKDDHVRSPHCMDCGVDTDANDEQYMLLDNVWRAANPAEAGMLCIECCERRLGRRLCREDFAKYLQTAFDDGMPVSARLGDRMWSRPTDLRTLVKIDPQPRA